MENIKYNSHSKEFFPGDFVISGKDDVDFSHRDYGVIQTVDHQGRTAHVKWFTTYTSADEPRYATLSHLIILISFKNIF